LLGRVDASPALGERRRLRDVDRHSVPLTRIAGERRQSLDLAHCTTMRRWSRRAAFEDYAHDGGSRRQPAYGRLNWYVPEPHRSFWQAHTPRVECPDIEMENAIDDR
jgi:hypothetical protein